MIEIGPQLATTIQILGTVFAATLIIWVLFRDL